MSRYISEADLLICLAKKPRYSSKTLGEAIDEAESIDIVRCSECKWEWTQKCPPHRMGLIHDSSDFCSYGVRKDTDKHDKAIEALGYLINQTERSRR